MPIKEFWKSPTVVKSLHPGQSLGVTDNGKASFVVTRAGKRPRKTRAVLEREAREICPRTTKLHLVQALVKMKGP